MLRRSRLLVPTSLGAVLLACSASFGPGSEVWVPDSASVLVRSAYTGVTDPRLSVISDSAGWEAAWSAICGTPELCPAPPRVDFAGHSVLLAAMGTRSSGGYVIRVDSVAHSASGDIVFGTDTSPGSTCFVTAALTAPVEAVVTPWPVGAAEWSTRSVVHNCL